MVVVVEASLETHDQIIHTHLPGRVFAAPVMCDASRPCARRSDQHERDRDLVVVPHVAAYSAGRCEERGLSLTLRGEASLLGGVHDGSFLAMTGLERGQIHRREASARASGERSRTAAKVRVDLVRRPPAEVLLEGLTAAIRYAP